MLAAAAGLLQPTVLSTGPGQGAAEDTGGSVLAVAKAVAAQHPSVGFRTDARVVVGEESHCLVALDGVGLVSVREGDAETVSTSTAPAACLDEPDVVAELVELLTNTDIAVDEVAATLRASAERFESSLAALVQQCMVCGYWTPAYLVDADGTCDLPTCDTTADDYLPRGR